MRRFDPFRKVTNGGEGGAVPSTAGAGGDDRSRTGSASPLPDADLEVGPGPLRPAR